MDAYAGLPGVLVLVAVKPQAQARPSRSLGRTRVDPGIVFAERLPTDERRRRS